MSAESIIRFGRDQHLVGNWVLADDGQTDTAIILLNASSDHRAGANRLYAELAHAFAKAGFSSLRFDYSSIGDSISPIEIRSGQDRRNPVGKVLPKFTNTQNQERRQNRDRRRGIPREVVEIEDAIRILTQQHKVKNIVLFGLCTSADDAFRAALIDTKVSGFIMLDGFGWRTQRYYIQYYLPRLLHLNRWLNYIGRKLGLIAPPGLGFEEEEFRQMPHQAEVRTTLPVLLTREVKIFAAYTGEEQEYYCYSTQFLDMLPDIDFGDLLRLEYLPAADHTFASISARDRLTELLIDWLKSEFTPD